MNSEKSVHVDREREMEHFLNMINTRDGAHVLLIQADAGMGKTTLLKEFWTQSEGVWRAQLNFKQLTYSIELLLEELAGQLAPDLKSQFWQRTQQLRQLMQSSMGYGLAPGAQTIAAQDIFAQYQRGVATLLRRLGPGHPQREDVLTYKGRLDENINFTRRMGDTETRRSERREILDNLNRVAQSALGIPFNELHEADAVTYAAGYSSPGESERRGANLRYQSMLMDAFLDSLVAANPDEQTVLLQFDTYEKANDEIQTWFTGFFLPRIYQYRWLVVVVAGRTIPELDLVGADWCLRQTLKPLKRKHIQEYVQRLELSLSDDVIEALYTFSDGKPYDLALFVKRWQVTKGGAPDE